MKNIKTYLDFIGEDKPAGAPDFHHSDAPDANGRFRDLSPKDLAAWLIKTRKKDVKKISGSLTQQVVFNRNEDPEYAEKMEKTRKEVYKQLGRQDLLDNMDESLNEAIKPDVKKMLTKISGAIGWKQDPKMRQDLLVKIEDAIKEVMTAHDYVIEADKKPGPDAYMTGLDKETEEDKEEVMKKQAEMDDDNPDAYKELPGDKEAQEKGQVKTSKHVKKYHELYGDDEANESANSKQIKELEKLLKSIKSNTPAAQGKKAAIQDDIERLKNESVVNEEKAEGDRGPIDDSAIETGLKNKAKETGVPIALLRIVMRRGLAAWKSGHRPGATQQQWGYARVNSFLTKQPGTWGGADSDVAKEVRDGGHDKNLKKG